MQTRQNRLFSNDFGKIHSMSRNEVEKFKKVSMWLLKKRRFLNGFQSGDFEFRNPWTGAKSSVWIRVSSGEDREHYIRFKYSYHFPDGDQELDYKVPFATTSCNYGGERYWFLCQFLKNDGKRCGKQVGVLYLKDGYFACRHCHKLVYKTNNLSGSEKKRGRIIPVGELDRMGDEIKKFSYRDKPTKRYKRFIKRKEKSMAALFASIDSGTAKFEKIRQRFER